MIKRLLSGLILMAAVNSQARQLQEPPTQVVYRFDDHRYLELKGWDCEGELWFTDTKRNIHSQIYYQFYRIFTRNFVHPSERYLAVTGWGGGAFRVSKDYGKTWQLVQFSPGENEPNGDSSPPYDDIISFTVVNDQGFLQTKHSLYMSSKPFDDPRLAAGGPGITYTLDDGDVYHIDPRSPGPAWGLDYITKRALKNDIAKYHTNYQNLPDKTPEVKNYTGWDHMRCDMDAGR
ncbi:T6SS immunity protein Tli3 family protein [Enterobacter oligotrophicus]|uniref:T6SS immunity protein Tli3 family protein n=2 Tax=Enterobacter oligotrophicus TaxID=2478464 RepID=UPI003B8A9746